MTTALAAFACVGCSQQELIDNQRAEGGVTLVASMEDYASPSTKTLIGHSASSDAIVMKWAVGEKLGAFGESDVNVEFTSTNSAEASTAVFTSTAATEAPKYAYYPYASGVTDKTAVPVTIAQEQVYSDNSSLAAYDFKIATGVETQDDGSYRMAFRQMLALLEISIDLDGLSGYEPSDGEKIVNVKIEPETAALWGNFTADLTNPDNGLTPVEDGEDGFNPAVTVTLSGQPDVSGKCTVYAMVAPADVSDGTWYFEIETTDNLISFTSATATDALEAGKYYAVPLTAAAIDSRGYHYDETGETQIAGAEIISLKEDGGDSGDGGEDGGDDPVISESETANCYMISAAGTYSFDAFVMGNGDGGIIADAGFHTSSAAIEGGASAELLWQDTYGFISSVSYDSAAKTITYTASANVGNACIALKDADGTILWSWHIWGTGDVAVEDDSYTNQAGALFTVMDRNLGQLKIVKSDIFPTDGSMYVISDNTIVSNLAESLQPTYHSTCYQWGRKDPIPTSTTYYDIDGNVLGDISASYPVHEATSEDEASIAFSVKNPDKMLYASSYNSADWLVTANQYLWGDNNSNTLYTWYSDGKLANAGAGAGWTDQKTIYDPCPAGYRVANKWTFSGFVSSGTGTSKFSSDDTTPEALTDNIKCITTYFMHGESQRYVPVFCCGYFFKGNDTDATGAYYPMSGYRQGVSGAPSGSGTHGYVWSATRNSTSDTQSTSSALDMGEYNWYVLAPSTSSHGGPNGSVNVAYYTNRLNALPVRCVREE